MTAVADDSGESGYAALLRGVNVGTANRVAMADLRRIADELGLGEPRTLLNSGNLTFHAEGLDPVVTSRRLESALAAELGITTRVVVVSAAQLAGTISNNPLLPAEDPARLLVAFLAPEADPERLGGLLERDWSPESLAVWGHSAYLWCPGGVAGSAVSAALSRELGDKFTARNWSTVLKLRAMLGG